jgi:hypothetical protein
MRTAATPMRIIVSVVIFVGLVVWSLLDLDTAAKIAGVIACLLALPAIWLVGGRQDSRRNGERASASSRQRIRGVWTKGKATQRSSTPADQRIVGVRADRDVEQSQ